MKNSLICFLFLFPQLLNAQPLPELKGKLDALVTEAVSKNVFSGNILVVNDHNVLFESVTGKADIANRIENTATTSFNIGSITKMFTGIITYQLAAEGKLGLSATVGKYLQGFAPEIADHVTIQQLIDHTSGLGDYSQQEGFMQTHQNIRLVADILPLIQKSPLLFTPGEGKQYSNSGYVVLSAIIEKIAGKDYATVVKERIFTPLGMDHSGFNAYAKAEKGKAIGYLSNQLGSLQNNLSMHVVGAGDGGIYSTTGDMMKFMQSFLYDNRLLSNENKLRCINTPLFPVTYASWEDFSQRGRLALAGGAPGISAVIALNREKNYSIIVLSNFDEGTAEQMNQRISAVLNNRTPAPFQIPPAKFIYALLKEKGAQYFLLNYQKDLQEAHISMDDDMNLLYAGKQLLEDKNADAAIALYTIYTKEFPNIVVAWNDMGDAYLLKGDKEKAKPCFQQALKLRPGNERARKALERL